MPTATSSSSRQSPCAPRGHTAPYRSADPDRELVTLVHAARAGDEAAWQRLVERFDHMLRDIARFYRLMPSDVDDVTQATWICLFKHIDRLREPAAVAGWLATTTRRECMRLLQRAVFEEPTDDRTLGDRADEHSPESRLLAAERGKILARAIAKLPERHREVMTLIAAAAAPDYRQISASLAMPIGSIGPIRKRCIARLERNAELSALRAVPD
jgi:RNA polymerase sigma factor (sigma-70 family)